MAALDDAKKTQAMFVSSLQQQHQQQHHQQQHHQKKPTQASTSDPSKPTSFENMSKLASKPQPSTSYPSDRPTHIASKFHDHAATQNASEKRQSASAPKSTDVSPITPSFVHSRPHSPSPDHRLDAPSPDNEQYSSPEIVSLKARRVPTGSRIIRKRA